MSDQQFNHEHEEAPPHIHPEIPEQRLQPKFQEWWMGGWIAPILAAGFTVFWGLLIYYLIGDRPTDWKYGTVPYVPAESVISSQKPPAHAVPKQVKLPYR